ncbi:DNA repair protein RecO [Microcoleus sp. FACHB-831]|uniref:DNA repair protein RecO n=1 Tax=Microcoleus sp. FACHB-831 TaxID=2692827 RepID=UPI0016855072|nr:DNA repair protein RecO [Microcoleus sp. FACHB-831]MBD1921479.1 DNA repair protein RecO [Microcoleus sp. FACHB-831]
MSRTYKATGINLKSMPLGESDRLLTILTKEFGLLRAVAPGARKHKSTLGGRSGLFVVNELMIAKGRSLDKITQAETLESYPGLSKDLGKLSAGQYLAEFVLSQALSDQPQEELFCLLNEHLSRLERLPASKGDGSGAFLVLAHLSHAVFHLLATFGLAPQVQVCCITQQTLKPNFKDPDWRVGFSSAAGGTVSLAALSSQWAGVKQPPAAIAVGMANKSGNQNSSDSTSYTTDAHPQTPLKLTTKLTAIELALLQQMSLAELSEIERSKAENAAWVSVEQTLRQYVQYHIGRSIRSAELMDACFSSQLNSV